MNKFSKVLILVLFLNLPTFSIAHIEHYNQLNKLEFDIYRNNKFIGKHIFTFNRSEDNLTVESKINFEIKKLGVVLYKYLAEGTEIYKKGSLIEFNSTTNQNKKEKYVNMKLLDDKYDIDGSSYQGKASAEYVIGTRWNHSIIEAKAQISAVSGRIIKQNVEFIGKETLNINGKNYETLHFNFLSSDKKLSKDKKLNTHIWYEEKTMNWVKASFNKSGKWEYRLKILN